MKTSIPQQLLERASRICSRVPLISWNRTSQEEGLAPARSSFRAAIVGLLILALTWSLVQPFRTQAAPKPVAKPNPPATSEPTSLLQNTETFNVYGPQRFTRLTGLAVNIVQNFSLPAEANAPFNILVENGAPEGSNRVSSANIKLNGSDLYTPSDFNQNVSSLTKAVTLSATNTLEVKLTSAAGSYLTITITATRNANQPVLASVTPARTTQGQILSVTLQGTNTHWVAGQTRASLGGEVAVGGAGYGELGPVTVVNATTAIAAVVVSPTAALEPRMAQVSTPLDGGTFEAVSLPAAFTVDAATAPGAAFTTVTTIAGGTGTSGYTDGNGPDARFKKLSGIAVGPDDTIYVADAGNQRIRMVHQSAGNAPTSWTVSTLAGNGTAGFADGSAAAAMFNNPQGIAVGPNGMVYVADTANNRIRRIAADGAVTTLAGDGTPGLQDGAGNQARFNAPQGIAVDSEGNVYVADTGNAAVRKIDGAGTVTTVAGDGSVGSNDSPGARFDGLVGIAVEGQNIYVYLADSGNHRIRRLDVAGTVITVTGAQRGFKDGSAAQARFAEPSGIVIDSDGQIVIADAVNSLIRSVDPNLATSGSNQAVTTLAGTGIRGLTDGAGNVARFFTPRGLAISNSSALIVADTGNQVLRRVLLPPIIHTLIPAIGRAGDTIEIHGARFDARGPERNVVRFTKSGGGTTFGSVTQATHTVVTVVVPADAATGPLTVETEGGTTTAPTDFVVNQFPAPVITDFSPKRGTPGTQVTLTGSNLKVDANDPSVTFAGNNGSRVPALVNSANATEVRVTVPNGAFTGLIELSHAGGTTSTASAFTVDTEQDFQLTVAPSTTTAVQGGAGTYVVYVTSAQSTFSQLASLTATGLPAGLTASFSPAQITAGANSTLTVQLSGTLSPGSYPFTIHGVASVAGNDLERTAGATLNVMAGGQTTLSGRVMSTDNEPIIGATASLDGKTAMTDAAGSFLLIGITAGTGRPLMIDGRTANSPNKTYPIIIEPANIMAGQANTNPFTFYLPPIDTQFEVEVVPGQNTVASNPRVPGLEMTIPAGANLRNRDGSPVSRVSITPLAIDRTPAPLPANVKTAMVFTSQPGGALSDIPMPVTYPNTLGMDPGTRVDLYAFNHDTVQWYVYGFGRVSADGKTISPEIDPATGRQYGLPDFSWHFPNAGPGGNPGDGDDDDDDCGGSNRGGNPVDYSTGMKIEETTDISLHGARGGLELKRTYTSDLAQLCDSCPFGRGTTHNYAIRLSGTFQTGGSGRVVMPEEGTGRLFNYVGTDSGGALVFTTSGTVGQLGDVVRKLTDGTLEYRRADANVMRFSSSGRLNTITDRNGNTTTLTYTGSNLTRITDAVGRSINLTYDFANRISTATDPLGRIWRYTYEGTPGIAGNPGLTTVTDPLGHVERYTYATGGRLASLRDARGNLVKQITYDGNGRVISQKFADGGTETYNYFLSGGIVTSTTITDVLGRVTTKRFNSSGYVLSVTDPLGQTTQYTRDLTTNQSTATTGSCGCAQETRQFDSRGNRIAQTDREGNTTRTEYDANNNITKITDRLGHVTTFGYDAHGNLSSFTNALGQTTLTEFDAFGQMLSVTNPLGQITRVEYDAYGNANAIVDPLGNRQIVEYDIMGRVLSGTDPLGRHTSATYDAMDRVLTSTDASGAITRYGHDDNGNVTSITDPLNRVWTSKYDVRNRLLEQKDPLGRTMRRLYDLTGKIISITTPEGRKAQFTYDGRGQIKTITDPLGGITRFTYNTNGNVTTLVDKRGNTTTYTYDSLFRPTASRNALGQLSTVTYNAAGQIAGAVDRLGRQSSYTYDSTSRLTGVTYADAQVSYQYDAANRLTQINDTQDGSASWNYDAGGRLLSETTPNGIVSYTYNAAGQRISMTVADRAPVTYSYDSAGRMETITQGAEIFTYSRDALSRITSLSRPNAITTNYTYDSAGRLERMQHVKGLNPPIEDYRFEYTLDDKIASITSLVNTTQLASEKTAGAADAGNRITQFGAATYTFDAAGQTTSKTDAQGTTQYTWDTRGRMTQATLPGGQTVTYTYDALGRRASRAANGTTTSFVYDGPDVVLDKNNDGSTVDYLNGRGIDTKLRQSSASTGSLYHLPDHLGSTAALTTAGGDVAEFQQYEAFGGTNGSSLTRYGFTGRERDPATRLLYYRARWYDPDQGRFMSEDPAGLNGGLNFFAYAGNDPLSLVDPLGLSWSTFGQGLVDGGSSGFVIGLIVGALFAALEAATAGTAAAVLVPILAIVMGAAAAEAIINEIIALLTEDMCPDVRHYRIGFLIGSVIGALAGGAVGSGIGGGPRGGGPGRRGPADDLVDLTDARGRQHILDGEPNGGGGHRAGTGRSGKSEFPADWTDEQILHNISDVATDPAATRVTQGNGNIRVDGTRDGVDIRVILDPPGSRIITGFPTNLPKNP
jgi:RHS repeat-associated protein